MLNDRIRAAAANARALLVDVGASAGVLAADPANYFNCNHLSEQGNTIVDNQKGGGSGGSATFIEDSQLQGGDGIALAITNGYGLDGAVLDAFSYTSVSGGAATALDPARMNPDDNDDPANWCPAVDVYGSGDRGTPKEANRACL